MYRPRVLVVDDLDSKRAYLEGLARSMCPRAEIISAVSAQQACAMIDALGKDAIDIGIIDFDLGGGLDGGNVIGHLRPKNPLAAITLATARREESFTEEAAPVALAAGADEALSTYQEDFESRLNEVLGMAA